MRKVKSVKATVVQQPVVVKSHRTYAQSSVLVVDTNISAAQQAAKAVVVEQQAATNHAEVAAAAQTQLSPKKVSVKQKVRAALLEADGALSLAELCVITDGTEITVRTALSDLKNPRYCGEGGALDIIRTADKKYLIQR